MLKNSPVFNNNDDDDDLPPICSGCKGYSGCTWPKCPK